MPLSLRASPGWDQLPWSAEMLPSEIQEPLRGHSGLPSVLDVEAELHEQIDEQPHVVEESGEPAIRPTVDLVLSYVHRIVDGVTANAFAEHFIESVEDTDMLLTRI